jgi:hypothetical protein
MSNRRRLRVPGRYEHQPQVHAVQEPAEAIRPLVQALAGSIRRKAVAESTATLERPATRTAVREASVGGATTTGPGRMLLRLISAGWSLNGNMYPAEVLRRDGPTAWPAGTRCYVDHASDEEEQAHPSGSVKNLAAILTEDARWDEASQSLIAEARLFEPWRGPLTDMAEANAIGMSIRAWVTGEQGAREGREGYIVDWVEGRSVDFVTVPAAGGGIISVLEAVGNPTPVVEAANLGAWLESRLHLALTAYADDMYGDGRLTREERLTLSAAIGDGLQAWTARVEADAPQLFLRSRWEEPEPLSAPVAAGESTPAEPEVRPETPPGEPAPTTPVVIPDVTDGAPPSAPETPSDPEEEPVSGIQTGAPPEQAGIATVPDNGQPPTPVVAPAVEAAPQPTAEAMSAAVQQMLAEAMRPLTEQLAQVTARENARDAENRALRNRQTAAEAVTAALRATEHADVTASIAARVNTRVLADVPTTTEGAVDDARLGEVIAAVITDEATHVRRERANALAEAGVGLPFGMGATTAQESADDGLDAELETFFSGSLGLSTEAAKIAARGRG